MFVEVTGGRLVGEGTFLHLPPPSPPSPILSRVNRQHSQKYHNEHKQKFDALDEETRKKVIRNGTSEPGHPQKYYNAEFIETIFRTAIPGSAAHERRGNEVIRLNYLNYN